jgi:hypothetical protein
MGVPMRQRHMVATQGQQVDTLPQAPVQGDAQQGRERPAAPAGWPFYVPYVCRCGVHVRASGQPRSTTVQDETSAMSAHLHESNDEVKSNMALKRTAQGHGLLLLINGKSSCRVRGYRLSTRNAAALAAPHCAAAQTGSNFSAIAFDQCHKCPRL